MIADSYKALRFRILFLIVLAGLFDFADNNPSKASGSDVNEVLESRPAEVKVAAIQCSSVLGDTQANRKKITSLVTEAAKNGAKIIVLPEACITGYLSQDLRTNWHIDNRPMEKVYKGKNPAGFAEEVPGPSTAHFCRLAKQLGVYITVPVIEVVHKPKSKDNVTEPNDAIYYNTVCLISPKGEIAAHYRKLRPWPYPEKSWATPGDLDVQVYDTEYGRVGLAICYDIHTILDKYKPYKIWVLLYSIAWVDSNFPIQWFWYDLPKRANDYHHYIIGANWSVDNAQAWYGYGFSEIISPDGEILVCSHRLYGSDIVYAVIKTAWVP